METESQPFRQMTVADFVGHLASSEPVPGGGSASAVAAALGAGLVAMVAALSAGRPKYAQHEATHATAGAIGRELSDRFLALAEADSQAYAGFSAALKMAKETEPERTARSAALQSAARVAAEVPLACVEACRELVLAAEMLAGRSNANASSDLAVASLLGEAAARGAAANVLVNLPSVGDEPYAATMTSRVEGLLAEITASGAALRDVVASGVARHPLPASNT
ncbi:MAG TPA: cyclodeaminase/cyclohydrolase family protein [Patescibacteria group bacterium]|nr:cyclodeaminase/cyclohydrolase family protein [Patescibacteria group bacterium]